MNKITTISVLCLGVLFLAGCGQQPTISNEQKSPPPIQKPASNPMIVIPETIAASKDATIYSNQEYGFQLTFTDNWKTYKTRVTNRENGSDIAFCDLIKDTKMETSIPGHVCLFKIIVTETEQWDKDAEPCKKDRNSDMCDWVDSEIGRNNIFVFSYVKAQDYGLEEKGAYEDIEKIIKSFQFRAIDTDRL